MLPRRHFTGQLAAVLLAGALAALALAPGRSAGWGPPLAAGPEPTLLFQQQDGVLSWRPGSAMRLLWAAPTQPVWAAAASGSPLALWTGSVLLLARGSQPPEPLPLPHGTAALRDLAWSPNARFLLVVPETGRPVVFDTVTQHWALLAAPSAALTRSFAWSPDSMHVGWLALGASGRAGLVLVADPITGRVQARGLAAWPALGVGWDTSATALWFVAYAKSEWAQDPSRDHGHRPTVYALPLPPEPAPRPVVQLPETARVRRFAVAPRPLMKGTPILLVTHTDRDDRLWALDAHQHLLLLRRLPGQIGPLIWSADGHWAAFTVTTAANTTPVASRRPAEEIGVWVLDAARGSLRQLTREPAARLQWVWAAPQDPIAAWRKFSTWRR